MFQLQSIHVSADITILCTLYPHPFYGFYTTHIYDIWLYFVTGVAVSCKAGLREKGLIRHWEEPPANWTSMGWGGPVWAGVMRDGGRERGMGEGGGQEVGGVD